jgi:hypothetical protein
MKPFTVPELHSLLVPHVSPCISLFLPMHRRHPAAAQDAIRLKNLLGTAERLLRGRYTPRDIQMLLEPVRVLANGELCRDRGILSNNGGWRTRMGGFAAFRSPGFTAYYRIPMPLPELAVVADTFHIKPLVQFLQSTRRFFVLTLSQRSVALYEGTPYALEKVELPDLPVALTETLATDRRESFLNFHSPHANGAAPIFHGHGGGQVSEKRKKTLEHFFRAIDTAVWRLLREECAPLVLAGVRYYHSLYRTISRYQYLAAHGVEGNYEGATPEELHAQVWPVVSELFRAREHEVLNEYTQLVGVGRATHHFLAVSRAAVHGQVRQLLVAENAHLWGRVDRVNGTIRQHAAQQDTHDDDILDDLAEAVLARAGEVLVVQPMRMPSGSPTAAILRW